MDFTAIPIFQVMQEKMKYHASRQAILAQNVANVDTPGYMAQDLKAPDFGSMLARKASASTMTMTNPRHMQPGMSGGQGQLISRESSYELNPIGNNVTVEEEMMHVAENQSEYQKMLSIYKKSMDLFKVALGKSGS